MGCLWIVDLKFYATFHSQRFVSRNIQCERLVAATLLDASLVILATKNSRSLPHCRAKAKMRLAAALVGLSVKLQTAGPTSICWGNRGPLIALCRLLLMVVSTPLRTVDRCCSGFPESGDIQMTFNL